MDILSTSEGEELAPGPVTEGAPATSTEAATTGFAPTEVTPGEVASVEFTTIVTSDSPSNDHSISFSDCFSYIISDFTDFVETTVAITLSTEAPHEEVIVPLVVDLVGLDYLYNRVIYSRVPLEAEPPMTAGTVFIIASIGVDYVCTQACSGISIGPCYCSNSQTCFPGSNQLFGLSNYSYQACSSGSGHQHYISSGCFHCSFSVHLGHAHGDFFFSDRSIIKYSR